MEARRKAGSEAVAGAGGVTLPLPTSRCLRPCPPSCMLQTGDWDLCATSGMPGTSQADPKPLE